MPKARLMDGARGGGNEGTGGQPCRAVSEGKGSTYVVHLANGGAAISGRSCHAQPYCALRYETDRPRTGPLSQSVVIHIYIHI